jgi:hypothetical protein
MEFTMTMTVRQLIEHLSQYDAELEVKIRDQQIPLILHHMPAHAVELEQFIQGTEVPEQTVVALG